MVCKYERYKTECKKTLEDTWKALPHNGGYCNFCFCTTRSQNKFWAQAEPENILGKQDYSLLIAMA